MLQLREYQKEAIEKIKETFDRGEKRQYIVMPTGAGKTITFLSFAKEFHERILIIVPTIELLNQVYDSARLFYTKSQISRKGGGHDEDLGEIHICVVNSLMEKYADFICEQYFDLIIIDEAHHSFGKYYQKVIEEATFAPNILGVTATPERKDNKKLEKILGVCDFIITIEELIEKKHLCDIEGYCVKTKIDISEVDRHNGDFSSSELFKRLCTDQRNDMIVEIVEKQLKERKKLVFCINVEHSMRITKLLNERGISATHIDGKMNRSERANILQAFREGNISVLCNCQLLTEGFDEPSIDGIIIARPTMSKGLFTQMIGRGLRNYPGKKNCMIIDVVDNNKYRKGFNSLLEDETFGEKESFKGIKELREHIEKEKIRLKEFEIERANLIESMKGPFYEREALPCTIDYLKENNIQFYEPISFCDANFLLWMNELKKKVNNGSYS